MLQRERIYQGSFLRKRSLFRSVLVIFLSLLLQGGNLFAQGCSWVEPSDGQFPLSSPGVTSTFIYGLVANTDGSVVLAGPTKDICTAACAAATGTVSYTYIQKMNSDGSVAWSNTIGDESYNTDFLGAASYGGNPMIVTTDGGYALAAVTTANDGTSKHYGSIIKISSTGNWQWTARASVSGSETQYFHDLVQTTDGSYIAVGQSGPVANPTFFASKFDNTGATLQWTQAYNGTGQYNSIIKTSDGGYALCGYDQVTLPSSATWKRAYICKVNSSFVLQWNYSYGSSAICSPPTETANEIAQTANGGFIVAGQEYMTCANGAYDAYLIYLDSNGGLLWTKTFGGTRTTTNASEIAHSVVVVEDGGFVFAGYTENFVNQATYGTGKAYIFKLNTDASVAWQKPVGLSGGNGTKRDEAFCIGRSSKAKDTYMGGRSQTATCTLASGPLAPTTISNSQVGFFSEVDPAGSVCCATTTTTTATSSGSDNNVITPSYTVDNTLRTRTSVTANTCVASTTCGTHTTPPGPPAPNGCKLCNSVSSFPCGPCDHFEWTGGYCERARKVGVAGAACGNNYIVTPLPIDLLSFTASCNSGAMLFKWSTASEKNNQFFSIERSDDGKAYQEIGTVTGAGTSSTVRNYEFVDFSSASDEGKEVKYFMLKQTDYNGRSVSYGPVYGKCDPGDGWGLVLENVFQEEQLKGTLILPEDAAVQISVFDLQGRMLVQENKSAVKGVNNLKINLTGLAAGAYFIRASDNKKSIIKKCMKF